MVHILCMMNSTRGRGGHEPPRWIRALVKETGGPTGTFGFHHAKNTISSVEKIRAFALSLALRS
jgi:hypothetical protein